MHIVYAKTLINIFLKKRSIGRFIKLCERYHTQYIVRYKTAKHVPIATPNNPIHFTNVIETNKFIITSIIAPDCVSLK